MGSQGLATAVAPGTVAITATYGSRTASVTVTVVAAPAGTVATLRAAYVPVNGPDGIFGFGAPATPGAVAVIAGSPFAAVPTPVAVAVDPSGRFVYVANASSGVSGYTVDGPTGALTPIAGSPFGMGINAQDVVVDPLGRFVYATGNGAIAGFRIEATSGVLTALAGSPFLFTGAQYPWRIAIDPSGQHAYVTNYYYYSVSAFRIDGATGGLSAIGSPAATAQYATEVTVDARGEFVFVTSQSGPGVSVYRRSTETGALTPVPGSPFATQQSGRAVATTPNGAFVYVAHGSTLSAFVVDAATGVLTPVPGSPFAAPNGAETLAIDPSGRSAYVVGTSRRIQTFAIDGTTGALTPGGVTTWSGGRPSDIALALTRTSATATLTGLQIVPDAPTLVTSQPGATQQFSLVGTYSDGTTQFLTASATWTASNTSVATISNTAGTTGRATSVGYGTTTVSASFGGFTAQTTLTVSFPALVSIAVSPSDPTILQGTAIQLTAIGTYSDNTTRDITASVVWSSANPAVATASNAVASRGLITSVGGGSTLITAQSGAVSGSTAFTTEDPLFTLRSIAIAPLNASIQPGSTLQYGATGTFADGSTRDLTPFVIWSSSAPGVAMMSNSAGSQGRASTLAVGNATIRAATGAYSAFTNLNVAPPTLQTIVISPDVASVPLGRSHQFRAAGTFSDGSVVDVTETVTWTLSSSTVAVISNTAGTRGLATSVTTGTTVITATSGTVTDSASLTVTAPVIAELAVTPIDPTISRGVAQQFTAMARMTDGSTQDATGTVAWTSANTSVATISSDAVSPGVATTLSTGSTLILATTPDNVAASSTLTVTGPALVSIEVAPSETTVLVGRRQQFTATGTFTDGTTQDLTATATWSSSDPSLAAVSNEAGAQGVAEGRQAGAVTISAASGNATGIATLNVQAGRKDPRFTFVTVNEGVAVYSVDTNSGHLAEVDGSPFAVAAGNGRSLAVHPSGRFVYVGNSACCSTTTNVINAFAVDATSGRLTPVAGSPFTAGSQPSFVALDRSGSFLYAANRASEDISAYRVNEVTGFLTPVSGSPFAAPSAALVLAPHPTADVLYAAGSGAIRTFAIDPASGALVSVASLATGAESIAVESTGRHLFSSGAGGLSTFAIDASTGVPQPTGTAVVVPTLTLATAPASAFLLGTNGADGTLSAFATEQNTGVLTEIGGSPFVVGTAPRGIAIDPSGRFVYVANSGSDDISRFLTDPIAGGVFASGAAPTATRTNPGSIAVSAALVDPAAALESIQIVPTDVTLALGRARQLTAIGSFGDGTTRFLTGSATWTSSDPSVATFSASTPQRGLVRTHAVGSVTVTATFEGISGSAPLTVSAPELLSIEVTPGGVSVPLGSTQQFTATGTFTDGSTQNITATGVWETAPASVASISNAAGSQGVATTLSVGVTTVTVTHIGVSGSATLTVAALAPVLASVQPTTGAQGQTLSVTVTGQYTNFVQGNTTASFGAGITVNSVTVTSPASATVNVSVALQATLGARAVTMTTGGEVVSTAAAFSVTQPVLLQISVTPSLPTVALGLTKQFTATGTYDNGATLDITTSVAWSSSVPAVATISNAAGSHGLATSVSAGTTTITATLANVIGTATLTVGPPAVAAVVVTPAESTVLEGRTQPFTATALLTNGGSQDVTALASWTAASTAVATVDAQGLATAVAAGSTTLTATYGGVSGAAAVTVTAAMRLTKYTYVVNQSANSISAYTVDAENGSLTPVPNSPFATGILPVSAAVHPSGKFVYTPNFSGNTVSVYAVQPDGALQPVSVAPFPNGSLPFFVAVAPSGQFAYVVNRAVATVSVHTVNSATGALTIVAGATVSTGGSPIYAGMHPSGQFLYVANAGTANVSAFSIDQTTGLLTTVSGSPYAAGTQPIQPVIDPTGRYLYVVNQGSNDVHGYTIDPVSGALAQISGSPYAVGSVPVGIEVDPTGGRVYVANSGSDKITGFAVNASDGSLTQLSGSPYAVGDGAYSIAFTGSGRQAIVASQRADAVSVHSVNAATGSLTAIAGSPFAAGDGPRFVAVVNDRVDGTATLVSLAVTPPSPTVQAGTAFQFTAVGTYSDGSQRFFTASALWSTTDGSIATISNTAGSNGRATALTPGLTTIAATFNGVSGTATLTVTAPPLVSIAVTPANPTIQSGATQQFVATGTYADNSTQVITSAVSWSSPLTSIATISNDAATRGLATGVAAGLTAISATLDGVTGTTQLTVTAAPVLSSLAPPSGAQGQTLTVTVTGQHTNFVQGQTTASFGAGITVNDVNVSSSTLATANVTVALDAALGVRTVAMTTGTEVVSAAAFSVTAPVLQSIMVAPVSPTIPLGLTQLFTATGTYDNALTADLTASVTWSSSVPAVATINSAGLASTVTRGTSIITATLGPVSGTATLAVTDPALTTITVAPTHASIIETQTQQFTATATYTDGSTQDVTASALWSTGQPSIATIATGGLATGAGVGFTTLTATQGAISSSATIYVRRAVAPQFAFVANQAGSVSVFTVDAVAGALTPVPGSPFAAGTNPWAVVVTPDNRFAYVANTGSSTGLGLCR